MYRSQTKFDKKQTSKQKWAAHGRTGQTAFSGLDLTAGARILKTPKEKGEIILLYVNLLKKQSYKISRARKIMQAIN